MPRPLESMDWTRESMIDSVLHDRQMAIIALKDKTQFSSCPEHAAEQYQSLIRIIWICDIQLLLLTYSN
jgi:hypothetical protein